MCVWKSLFHIWFWKVFFCWAEDSRCTIFLFVFCFSFSTLKTDSTVFLLALFSVTNPYHIYMCSFYVCHIFFLLMLLRVSLLSLFLSNLILMCLGVVPFIFLVLRDCRASCIWVYGFHQIWKFGAFIASNIFTSFPLEIPVHIYDEYIWNDCESLLAFFNCYFLFSLCFIFYSFHSYFFKFTNIFFSIVYHANCPHSLYFSSQTLYFSSLEVGFGSFYNSQVFF